METVSGEVIESWLDATTTWMEVPLRTVTPD